MFTFSEFTLSVRARRSRRAALTAARGRTTGRGRIHDESIAHRRGSEDASFPAAPPVFDAATGLPGPRLSPRRWSANDLLSLAALPLTPGSPTGRR
ncbi:MAG TPA: hypothetical protein VN796_09730 [Acidimicrobiales bacterium]|nr:hypothetical protein [Acidimicrobiales bacterium]